MTSISVVIPSKNRQAQLRLAVQSASQNALIDEIIVVDDSSVVGLEVGLFDTLNRGDKLKVVKNTCADGAQGARVTGALEAKNDIVLFLDSDDLLIDEGVTKLYRKLIVDSNVAFVYGNVMFRNKKSNFLQIDGNGFPIVLKNLSLCLFSGLMVRKSLVPWSSLDLTLPAWQDDDFCLTVCKNHKIKFVDTLVAKVLVSPDSISKSKQKQFLGLALLINKWKKDLVNEFGIGRLLLWRLRLLAILLFVVAEDLGGYDASNRMISFILRICSCIINIIGQLIRIFVRPFFDRSYA